ncbi:MAG: universal stress protein [Treponema sp.]|jgi:nucleotide-binding universal stress UspA family protein|nr:universal stress protein [Treponema sp.]
MINPLFQNLLVAINGSEASIQAAKYGILMAKCYHCTIKAVYVVDMATLKQLTLSKFFIPEESSEYERNLCQDGERYLEYVAALGLQKGIKVETELRKGAVWSQVITAADEMKASLILLGGYVQDALAQSSKRDAVSTSNHVIIANTPCSVLIVREKQIEQLFKIG